MMIWQFRFNMVLALLYMVSFAAFAKDDPHAHHKHHMQKKVVDANQAKVNLANTPLVNQYGKKVVLKDGVIGDRIAVVSFAYTTCTTVCPVVSAIFSQVYKRLQKENIGKHVELVTITVDPNRDTPSRLLAYSKKHGSGKGWSWLTGEKDNIIQALSAFGAYTVSYEDHPAMLLVGDETQGRWYRYYGFSAPDIIVKQVKALLKQRKI